METQLEEYKARHKEFQEYREKIENECDGMWDCCRNWKCYCSSGHHDFPNYLNHLTGFISIEQISEQLKDMREFCDGWDDHKVKISLCNETP
jgi:hypothetical protein